LGDGSLYSDFKADGQWQLTPGKQARGVWRPAADKASLTYRVRISHGRKSGSFDTRMTPTWALMRGDDLVPAAKLDQQDGIELVSRLEFELPTGWKSVETAWPRIGKNKFRVDNVSRLFDRPTGWMLAGHLGSRRTRLGETEVTVASPQGQGMRRMDVLTLLTFVWPQVQAVYPRHPVKLLIVGANDPMWRGSLGAHESIYLNTRLPLVSESGTSALVRELAQVFGRINDQQRSDWISEGFAEYYAIELVRRAGGISDERYESLQKKLAKDSQKVTTLRGEQVSPAQVSKAVVLMQELDREIRLKTRNKRSLDDVLRGAMHLESVDTKEFVQLAESVIGESSKVLDTELLQ
jgi:predicted metalloprotease with PDZ domain